MARNYASLRRLASGEFCNPTWRGRFAAASALDWEMGGELIYFEICSAVNKPFCIGMESAKTLHRKSFICFSGSGVIRLGK